MSSNGNLVQSWAERRQALDALGLPDYASYLKSDIWQGFKAELLERSQWLYSRCQICDSTHNLQWHHSSYRYLGNPSKQRLVVFVFCQRCHNAIHAYAGEHPQQSLEVSTNKWLAYFGQGSLPLGQSYEHLN